MNAGRILIVDDDEAIRSALGEYFTSCGHEVVTAIDGADALMKFVPGRFDCVISDLMMPKIDGLELLKRIKMQDSLVYFLMITGFPDTNTAVNAIKEGAYDYVTKPFHMEDIRIKVERILSTRKTKKSLKTMTGLFWALIASIPIWLILGIILGMIWK
ncbi:MAG: response regulator [Deltaproteobacteria bacterium]|nr:response regulator [Deltaproteobacteria bacterium]